MILPKLYLFIWISLLHDVSLLALKYQPVNMKPFLCLKQSTASNSFEMSAKVKSGLDVLILLIILFTGTLCVYVFLIYTKLVRLSSCQGCSTPIFFPSTIRPPLILVLQLSSLFLCNHFGLLKCISSQLCALDGDRFKCCGAAFMSTRCSYDSFEYICEGGAT